MSQSKTFNQDSQTKTFILNLTNNAGEQWRGNVLWVDGRCQQQFESMQELLELIGSAIDNTAQIL